MRHPAGYAIDQLPWVTDLAEAVGELPHHAVKPPTVTICDFVAPRYVKISDFSIDEALEHTRIIP